MAKKREIIQVDIRDTDVAFVGYDYPPASVFPSGSVSAAQIRDVDPTSAPPEIRLGTGETLFVHAFAKEDLWQFCEQHAVPLLRRPDLWGALLEPFLDTEFTPEDARQTSELLGSFGLSEDEITAIRARFAPAMIAYNLESGLWDWVHLGLADLLDALLGKLAGEKYKMPPDEYATTYSWAMALADRSRHASQAIDNSSA